jgi:hypothetical protein
MSDAVAQGASSVGFAALLAVAGGAVASGRSRSGGWSSGGP